MLAFQPPRIQIDDPADEYLRSSLQSYVDDGAKRVETFFGKPYAKPYTVEIIPSRKAFDAIFKQRWGVDHTDSWAVAAGVSEGLLVLSPRVWKTQATEHDPDDQGHIRRIIAHELTHVYHGQINPSNDFDGMDDLAWLAEGAATYVSGQMDNEHKGEDLQALKEGKAPTSLATAWSGRYRYAIAGSIVRYVDKRWGRQKLIEILGFTKQQDVLASLGTTEDRFLKDWESSVAGH